MIDPSQNSLPYLVMAGLCAAIIVMMDVGMTYRLDELRRLWRDRRARPYRILTKDDLAIYEQKLQSAYERNAWHQKQALILKATGGAIRQAHLEWYASVCLGRDREDPIPDFEPPSWIEYRLDTDLGTFAVLDYQRALRTGQPRDASIAALRECRDNGSDIALIEYGAALLNGEIAMPPDQDPIREGHYCLRVACSRDNPRALTLLGLILLQGKNLPADPVTGMSMLHGAAKLGHGPAITALAWVLARGAYGVPPDPTASTHVAVTLAVPYRRWLLALGLYDGAHGFRDRLLDGLDEMFYSKQDISFADPHRAPRRLEPAPPIR